jgi:hypothetical protein
MCFKQTSLDELSVQKVTALISLINATFHFTTAGEFKLVLNLHFNHPGVHEYLV